MGGGADNWNIPVTLNIANPYSYESSIGCTCTVFVSETTTWEDLIKKYGSYAPCWGNHDNSTAYSDSPVWYLDFEPYKTVVKTNYCFGLVRQNLENSTQGLIQTCGVTSSPACSIDPDTGGLVTTYIHFAFLPNAGGPKEVTDKSGILWDTLVVDCDNYYSSCICILESTLVTLADGRKKKVQDITYKDSLLVWDFDKGEFSSAPLLWASKPFHSSHYYRLTFSDNTILEVVSTDGKAHRVFNRENGEFTYGSYFHLGQHTFKDDSSRPYLVSVELVEKECTYHNPITNYHMNFFANSILTSCGYNNMYPIKDMKFVKDGRKPIPKQIYGENIIEDKWYEGLRLSEQDLEKRSVLKAQKYITRCKMNDKARNNKAA